MEKKSVKSIKKTKEKDSQSTSIISNKKTDKVRKDEVLKEKKKKPKLSLTGNDEDLKNKSVDVIKELGEKPKNEDKNISKKEKKIITTDTKKSEKKNKT